MASAHDLRAEFDSLFQILEGMRRLQTIAQSMNEFADQAQALGDFGKGVRTATLEMEEASKRLKEIAVSPGPSAQATSGEAGPAAGAPRSLGEMAFQMVNSFHVFDALSEGVGTLSKRFNDSYEESPLLQNFVGGLGYAVFGLYAFTKAVLGVNAAWRAVKIVRESKAGQKIGQMAGNFGARARGGAQAAFGGARAVFGGARAGLGQARIAFSAKSSALLASFKSLKTAKFNLGGNGYGKLKAMGELVSSMKFKSMKFGPMTSGLSSVLKFIPLLKTGFLGLGKALMSLMLNPFGLLIAGIVAVGYGIYQLWNNWASVSEWLRNLWGKIVGFFTDGFVGKLVDGLLTFNPYALMVKAFSSLFEFLTTIDLFEMGASLISSLTDGIVSLISKPMDMIKSILPSFSWFGNDDEDKEDNIIAQNRKLRGAPLLNGAATVATLMGGAAAAASPPAIDLMQDPHPVVEVASATESYNNATTHRNDITYVQEVKVSITSGEGSQPEAVRRQIVAALDESYGHFKQRMKEDERRRVRKSYDDPA